MTTSASAAPGSGWTRISAAKVYGAARDLTAVTDHELIYPPVQAFWDAAVTGS